MLADGKMGSGGGFMKPTKLYKMAILLPFLWPLAGWLCAQDAVPSSTVSPAKAMTGESVSKIVNVVFDPLPPGWVAEQNVMDPIWEPLGFKGGTTTLMEARLLETTFPLGVTRTPLFIKVGLAYTWS
jgi:hypothetical protein